MENNTSQKKIKEMVLCFIQKDGRVLLGRKTKKIGKGLFNAPGGKLEEGDNSIEDAVRREVEEEAGLAVGELEYCGLVNFEFPENINKVYLYRTEDFEGEPVETEEMEDFRWFDTEELPLKEMLEADSHFIPEILEGKKIEARFMYTEDFRVTSWEINELETETGRELRNMR